MLGVDYRSGRVVYEGELSTSAQIGVVLYGPLFDLHFNKSLLHTGANKNIKFLTYSCDNPVA